MSIKYEMLSKSTPLGSHAFPKGADILIKLTVSDMPIENAWFYIGNDEQVFFGREADIKREGNDIAISFSLTHDLLPIEDGLCFTHFEFMSNGMRYYTAFDFDKVYLDTKFVNETQLLIYNEQYSSPDWIFGGAMYQIFPDRFARGGNVTRREDAVYDEDWENGIPEYPLVRGEAFPNNKHFGGTLYGVADKLDYLESLGINCIYFTPIFEAYSNHKYDTADFLSVDRSFGGDAALKHLIDKAHERGIKVILDGVFNHVGNDSVYFDAYGKYGNGACQSKDSPYYSWFKFHSYPDSYESWWGIKNLPRTVRSEEYISFITDSVIPKYMQMGIDGWRLDVADELESHFLDRIVASIKSYKNDAIVIGEVWEDASNKIAYDERKRYFRGRQLDSVTNYPIRNALIDYVKYGNAEFLADTVNVLARNYPLHKLNALMNFLGSHDTERIATVLGGEDDMGEDNAVLAVKRMDNATREKTKKLLAEAYKILAFLPGVPCIYYGDEIALEGYHDPFNRRPFPESGFSDSYSDNFKKANEIRKDESVFKNSIAYAEPLADGVLKITRNGVGKRLVLLANMSGSDFSVNLEKAYDLYNNVEIDGNVVLEPHTVFVFRQVD